MIIEFGNDPQNSTNKNLTDRQKTIKRLMLEDNTITVNQLNGILNVSSSTIKRDVTKLKENGEIRYEGSSKKRLLDYK